ncbi:MAG: BMP family ABC transporter substrate-binding protein [Candidatus Bipolaricaulota bacterium]|nr:MAG: BMP family ABC transporter substrate-binding protein [Candidatus Bipolaricaulota bacterium]
MKRGALLLGVVALVLTASLAGFADAYVPGSPIKVGFIYVGPIGDYGWTYAHNEGRLAVEALPFAETVYVESVAEGDEDAVIDDLISTHGVNVIFTTSFGFMWGTQAAALRHPDLIFAHASGFMRAPNMMSYMADFYQVYYLNGIVAGALTKTSKVGYVGAFPIPEVKRHINAWALGVQAANPDCDVHVRWIESWFSPPAAAEATEALIAEGCDIFAFTEDSPTVVQTAAANDLVSFGHYGSQMYTFAPNHVVSGQAIDWGIIYVDFLQKIYDGVYTAQNLEHVDYWWLMTQKAVFPEASPGVTINPLFVDDLEAYMIDDPTFGTISAYDLHNIRLAQFSDPGVTFDPFQGPIVDRQGVEQVPAGMWLSVDALITMEWAASNVVGPWPNEPE